MSSLNVAVIVKLESDFSEENARYNPEFPSIANRISKLKYDEDNISHTILPNRALALRLHRNNFVKAL